MLVCFSPLTPVFFFKSLVLRTIHTHHDPYWVFYVSKQGCVVFICRICKFLFACKGNLYILGHPEGGGSHLKISWLTLYFTSDTD